MRKRKIFIFRDDAIDFALYLQEKKGYKVKFENGYNEYRVTWFEKI